MDNKFLIKEYASFEIDTDDDQADGVVSKRPKVSKYGNMLVTGILQRANALNQNGRIYPREILEREVRNYNKLIQERRATGELDHANETVINLKNVSHVITEVWWEGDTLKGTMEVLENMIQGKQLKALFDSKIKVGISSRGVGSVTKQGEANIVQEDFTLLCFDIVSEPSTQNAFMIPESINESILKTIFTRSDRIDRISNEILSFKNTKS